MGEITFIASPEDGFTARALGAAVFTEADTEDQLAGNVRDALACHFEAAERPRVIRLHFVRDELITA